jgi:hypothetical protein
MGTIKSADDLETSEIADMRIGLARLGIDTLAMAMHGLSPDANRRIRRSLSLVRRIKLALSPIARTSVPLGAVEKAHRELVERFNAARG